SPARSDARDGAALCSDAAHLLCAGTGAPRRRAPDRALCDASSRESRMSWDWHYAWSVLPPLLRAFVVTLEASLAGFVLAAILGLVWAVSRMAPVRIVAGTVFWIVEFVRSTPLLIQLYFLYYVLPEYGVVLSPLAIGILALGLHYSCYTAEVYRAGIEAVPTGQWEAARALNLTPRAIWLRIVLPQALPPAVPVLGNYLIAIFKETPLL